MQTQKQTVKDNTQDSINVINVWQIQTESDM